MPQSGDVVVSRAEYDDDPWSLYMFSLVDGQLKQKNIKSTCYHDASAYTLPPIIGGREQLAVSCELCADIELLDLQTVKWSTAFKGPTGTLCLGDNNKLFVQSSGDDTILKLDCSGPVFEGPIRILHTHGVFQHVLCFSPVRCFNSG